MLKGKVNRNGRNVGVEVARKRRSNERIFVVLVVIPTDVPRQPFAGIKGHRGKRQLIMRDKRPQRLKSIEGQDISTYVGKTVTEFGSELSLGFEHKGR